MGLTLSKDGSKLLVDNGHWVAVHDTDRGGAFCGLFFKKGVNGNLLAAPVEMGFGACLDINEKHPAVRINEAEGAVNLTFTGVLRDAAGNGRIGYMQFWAYREYGVHRSQQVYFEHGEADPRELVLSRVRADAAFHRFLAEPAAQEWRDALADQIHYSVNPKSFGLFADTGEGMQFVRGDDTASWGFDFQAMDTVYGDLGCASEGAAVLLEHSPLKNLPQGTAAPAQSSEGLSFSSFLGISNYKSRPYLPYKELSIASQPFPSDADIRTFSEIGINVLRIHEGANFVNFTADHWMDGNFPPYEGAQLTELKRLVHTAHAYGIKVLPYFMPQGVHPTSPAFREHPREWQKRGIPDQALVFACPGEGQVWETYMCLESQFHNWILEHVTRVLEEYDFDGFYFDSANPLSICFHPEHARVPHSCEGAFLWLLTELRKRFPGKLIFHHQMTNDVNLLHANIVDHIINLEEYGFSTPDELCPLPFGLTAQRACASIGPVPQPFLPKDGEPVSPGLAMTKYIPGKEPTPTRELARAGFPYCVVHGVLPYLYTWMEQLTLGYKGNKDRLEDTEGFYYFYRLLKVLDNYAIEEYYAPEEHVFDIPPGIETAALKTPGGCLILLASVSKSGLDDVKLAVNENFVGALGSEQWKNARVIASTRDLAVSLDERRVIQLGPVYPNELYIIELA